MSLRPDYLSLSITRPNQINYVIEVNLWNGDIFTGAGYTVLTLPEGSSISLTLGWIKSDPLLEGTTRADWVSKAFLTGFSQNVSYGIGDMFKHIKDIDNNKYIKCIEYISVGKTIVEPRDGRKEWLTANEFGFGSRGLDVGGTYSIDIKDLIDSIRYRFDSMTTIYNEGFLKYLLEDQLERNIIKKRLAFGHFC